MTVARSAAVQPCRAAVRQIIREARTRCAWDVETEDSVMSRLAADDIGS
jgi:hypothetical protein